MITGDIAHLCTEIIHRYVENKKAKLQLEVARILIPKIRECYALKVLGECSVDILKDCEGTIKCIGKRQWLFLSIMWRNIFIDAWTASLNKVIGTLNSYW